MTSLTAFCKDHDLPKSTVHRYLKDQGFGTANGLTNAAEQAALLKFKPEAVQASVVSIESGNHRMTVTTPEIAGSFDLAQFRDSESLVIEDPNSVANQFLVVADMLIAGLDQDATERETRLRQTRSAREQVTAKASQLQLEQRLYRERTRQTDTAQTAETTALQQAMSQLQALGKPSGDADGGV